MQMAVENLSPQIVIVDELSTQSECNSARTMAQRGIKLIATCHGTSMVELLCDEERSLLLGGIKSVTLARQEVEARIAKGCPPEKQVMLRKYEPLFDIIIEIQQRHLWHIHRSPKEAVDAWLQRTPVIAWRATPGNFEQVLAIPSEHGFFYEPMSKETGTASGHEATPATMTSKGSVP